jgi:uncharacterized protein with FMN-binding domain
MRRTIVAVATTASLIPAGSLGVVAEARTAPIATAASGKLYVGASEHMKWGNVTVRIWVSGKHMNDVRGTYPSERPKSKHINDHAGPILRSEALKAQNASVKTVSGATMSSTAFKASLNSARSKAKL